MTDLLTDSDVAVLQAARAILAALDKRAMMDSFEIEKGFDAAGYGRVAATAACACDAVFDVLSTAKHYGKCDISEVQLHGPREEVAA